MDPWVVTLVLFSALILGIGLGFPIAFVLAGISVIFTFILWGTQGLLMLTTMLYAEGTNFLLIAIPLFVLMANFLEQSAIADDLYQAMYYWLGFLPGGLASGTVIICAIFAAMAGISGVATITMGLIAIPSMFKRNYSKRLALGTVSAGGALGILIPPSIIAVVYGSITGTSVGGLFMGGVFPGILLSLLFILYITLFALINPKTAPPLKEKYSLKEKILILKGLIFPILLIVLVLGSIYGGIATPTEAAAIGAFGAMICCLVRKKLTLQLIQTALWRTFKITVMAIWIIFGAACFTSIYSIGGASEFVLSLIEGLQVPPIIILIFMLLIWFILGMFLDPLGMLLITVPVFLPLSTALGFDPLWFGILFIISSESAYITPPFGFNLFYLKAIVPESITMMDIYLSIIPFVILQIITMALVIIFPDIALWLPNTMVG
jgi:tripartite ATP-independent transporter DctM subunit